MAEIFIHIFGLLSFTFNLSISIKNEYLDSVEGKFSAGNFSYYNLLHPGIVLLELISQTGDCDIYVSQHYKKPTFEPHTYCLHSSSCGLDTVVIPNSFKRPVTIGIYGHPFHDQSHCLLNIYQIDLSKVDKEHSDELYITTKYGKHKPNEYISYYDHENSAPNIFIVVLYSIWFYLSEIFLLLVESYQTGNPLIDLLNNFI